MVRDKIHNKHKAREQYYGMANPMRCKYHGKMDPPAYIQNKTMNREGKIRWIGKICTTQLK